MYYSTCIKIFIQTDKVNDFIAYSRSVVDQSRKEIGCLWFDLMQSDLEPNTFLFYEAYKSEDDFKLHLQESYVRDWLTETKKIMVGKGFELNSYRQVY
jgi:quinol monooxygenase YgiN